MKKLALLFAILILATPAFAETLADAEQVVGIVVDDISSPAQLKELVQAIDAEYRNAIARSGTAGILEMRDRAVQHLVENGEYEWLLEYSLAYNLMDIRTMPLEDLNLLHGILGDVISSREAEISANSPKYDKAMTVEDAMAVIGEEASNNDCTYRSCEPWEDGYYLIHVNLDTPFTFETGLVNAIRYTIDFGRQAFELDGIHTLRFEFHQETRDKYGNASEGSPIIWKLKESTFNKMDIDYFYTNTHSNTKRFINACDSAAVASVYKNVAK